MSTTRTTLADVPEHQADDALRQDLSRRLAGIEAGISTTENLRSRLRNETEGRARLIGEAAALLGPSPDAPTPTSTATLDRELDAMRHERSVLREALTQLDERIRQRRDRLARDIAPPYAADYKAGVVDLARALITASRADDRNRQLRDACEAAIGGSALGFCRPMGLGEIGSLRDAQSGIRRFLDEAVEFGFVTAAWVAKECPEIADQARLEAKAAARGPTRHLRAA